MKKEEMVTLLRSAGVDENAVNLAVNAWEMGVDYEREQQQLWIQKLQDAKQEAKNEQKGN